MKYRATHLVSCPLPAGSVHILVERSVLSVLAYLSWLSCARWEVFTPLNAAEGWFGRGQQGQTRSGTGSHGRENPLAARRARGPWGASPVGFFKAEKALRVSGKGQ